MFPPSYNPILGIKKRLGWIAIILLSGYSCGAQEIPETRWLTQFTFYGENTEFFEPYRLRATTLGQQFTTELEVEANSQTQLLAGLFLDHPSALETDVDVKPLLSFRFHEYESLGIFGTLQTVARHGMIEPLEVLTLEYTRPVEYGVQWIQKGKLFNMDAFLDWQDLLTSTQRETFDYGGSAEFSPLDFASLMGQVHGYHVGGVSFPGPVWNNFDMALGPRLETAGPGKRQDSLAFLGLLSKTFGLSGYPGPEMGYALYTKAVVWVLPDINLFGIGWVGQDYYSAEGDPNYNSVGYDGVYYKSNRTYEETGLQYQLEMPSGVSFNFELRFLWADQWDGNEFRLSAIVPFDILIHKKQEQESAKNEP